MIDPITVFATAGNALQFVQLGLTISAKTIDYSSGGGNNEFDMLQNCVQRLVVASVQLQDSLKATASSTTLPGPTRALYSANSECLRVSKELTGLLQNLG